MNSKCSKLIFVIDGELHSEVMNSEGETCIIDILQKGDVIGQYSIINEEELYFSLQTVTDCTLMTVERNFLYTTNIVGMKEAITFGRELIAEEGVPI